MVNAPPMITGTKFNPADPNMLLNKISPFITPNSLTTGMTTSAEMDCTVPFIEDNGYISYTHTSYCWDNDSEKYIAPGALVYVQRYGVEKLTADMTLSTLNDNLAMAHEQYMKDLRIEDPTALQFQNFLKLYGEDVLGEYDLAQEKGLDLNDIFREDYADISQFFNIANHEDYRYLTRMGILKQVNFFGVQLNSGETSAQMNPYDKLYDKEATNLNIVIGKKVEVANIWGGSNKIGVGTELFVILKKTLSGDGPYQATPYADKLRPYPSLRETWGAHVWYIGAVKYKPEVNPCVETIKQAISNNDPINGMKAIQRLPMLWIDVKI